MSWRAAATAALKRKKATEQELERLQGTRFQLEMQVNTLESASFNAETMAAMKKAASALKDIHGTLYVPRCGPAPAVLMVMRQEHRQGRRDDGGHPGADAARERGLGYHLIGCVYRRRARRGASHPTFTLDASPVWRRRRFWN